MISELELGTEEEANLKKRKNVLILEIFLVPTKPGSPRKKRSVCLPSRFQARAAATPASRATACRENSTPTPGLRPTHSGASRPLSSSLAISDSLAADSFLHLLLGVGRPAPLSSTSTLLVVSVLW